MNSKPLVFVGAVFAAVCVAAAVVVVWREVALAKKIERDARSQQVQPPQQQSIAPSAVQLVAPQPALPERPVTPTKSEPVMPTPQIANFTQPEPALAPDSNFDDPVFKEQLGRYALSYVGADPAADEVWACLIYDPDLSEKVREDLMEDLNENGFSDGNGRRATVDDLPLIESRLALLEDHMVGADEFMMAHLGEAYKDLMNMWTRLNQQ